MDTEIITDVDLLPKTGPCGVGDCERVIDTPQGMAVHRSRAHGLKGVNARNKKKGKSRKRNNGSSDNLPAVIQKPKEKRFIASDLAIGMDAVLEVVFPKGIPVHKIGPTVRWVQATEELVR